MIRVILTDIEGTTSSISFVKDVLFPYARKHLPAFIVTHADDFAVQHWLHEAAKDAGFVSASQQEMIGLLQKWIDEDRKSTALKALQGMIWEEGYDNGAYQAHIYDDVPVALEKWREAGVHLFVYSSGSVQAQKLLFRHTTHGNLEHFFHGHFDTGMGHKRDPDSYRRIARQIQEAVGVRSPDAILFLSDVVEELDAARMAGMGTTLLARPPAACPANSTHPCVENFDPIDVS
jgi:enolase-phosphatase E1